MPKSVIGVISIVLLIATIFFPKNAFGQEITQNTATTPTPTINSTSSANIIVKYDLAYPGILPDSFFYKIKVFRDKVSASLISDPKNKIKFFLLQADKGILASAILVDKKNIELAKQTALKAENNMTLLTQELWKLPKRLDPTLYNKLKSASLKHQEVLNSLGKRVGGKDAKTFQTVSDFSKRNWQTIEQFQTRPNIVK